MGYPSANMGEGIMELKDKKECGCPITLPDGVHTHRFCTLPYEFPNNSVAKSSTNVLQASVCQSCGCKLDGKTLKKVCNCRCHTEGPR